MSSTLDTAAQDLMEGTTSNDEPLSKAALDYNVPILADHLRRAFDGFMMSDFDPDPEGNR